MYKIYIEDENGFGRTPYRHLQDKERALKTAKKFYERRAKPIGAIVSVVEETEILIKQFGKYHSEVEG